MVEFMVDLDHLMNKDINNAFQKESHTAHPVQAPTILILSIPIIK
jgi:hypothetical protein